MAKEHGIRKHGSVKPLYIKVRCDSCHKGETLACYEDDVGKRGFNVKYIECLGCFKVVCEICHGKEKLSHCPFCGREKLREIIPENVYKCNICFLDEKKQLCMPCKYPHLKK